MTDYIKRIQSGLSRKVKVSRAQIKEYMEMHHIDLENPGQEGIEAVKFYFLDVAQSATQGEKETLITPVTTASEAIENKVLAHNTVPSETQETHDIMDAPVPENETALAINAEVRGMVGFKAESMGLQLAESQIEIIASQIDSSGSSFSQTVKDIENALIAYIDYQHSQESRQVDSMLERVTDRVYEKNHAINQQLTGGISNFKGTLEALSQQQKKSANTILLRLKVPV